MKIGDTTGYHNKILPSSPPVDLVRRVLIISIKMISNAMMLQFKILYRNHTLDIMMNKNNILTKSTVEIFTLKQAIDYTESFCLVKVYFRWPELRLVSKM